MNYFKVIQNTMNNSWKRKHFTFSEFVNKTRKKVYQEANIRNVIILGSHGEGQNNEQ